MKYILNSLTKRYGIGSRPMTEDDFYRICEHEGIEVLQSPEKFSFYFTMLDHHFIVLPKRRKGLKLIYAMFHELGHFAMHVGSEPNAAFLNGHSKDEAEADAIALIAMVPRSKLKELAFLDGSRFGHHLYNERLRLFFLYDI
jgi:Zn-dependent peptidase ImmA (M78 family)